eukprot:Phypoly_transcript_17686.p1 GENE.Phypoly_transcript_17686~~Phypoly_transcript_17686.p1  ORF type:complete len:205 (+),score=26.74 Phypoly_transcript_17686:123-737(+)
MANVEIKVGTSKVAGILHLAKSNNAMILVSGAGGGLWGPGGIYGELGRRLKDNNITALQLDYRQPARIKPCLEDMNAALEMLNEKYGITNSIVVGWSFGGAVVITAGAQHPGIKGVATVASQTAETSLISELYKPILLMHGTGDTCLPHRCSKSLHAAAKGQKELVLFENDNHGLTRNSPIVVSNLVNFANSVFSQQMVEERAL